jgi:hypothetical protein
MVSLRFAAFAIESVPATLFQGEEPRCRFGNCGATSSDRFAVTVVHLLPGLAAASAAPIASIATVAGFANDRLDDCITRRSRRAFGIAARLPSFEW